MDDTVSLLNQLLAGRYRVERELGGGGMGTVYLADDLKHGRRVALKVLHRDLGASLGAHRFLEETRVTATLQHPHILPLFDSGEAGGLLFYVTPYIAGESLRGRLAREGKLPLDEVARILRDVVDGLSAAHAQGIVHRDIKPENILISGRHAVIADFGIAKAVTTTSVAPQRTTGGVALGTPDYMAPEQITADPEVDVRADLYAVGAMAYEMLTGAPPFAGRPAAQVYLAHLAEAPRPLGDLRPAIPAGFEALVMRCLEKRPTDRWQSADELLEQLDRHAAVISVESPVSDRWRRLLPAWRRLSPAWRRAVVATLATGALVAGGAWLVRAGSDTVADGEARLVVTPFASNDEGGWHTGDRVSERVAAAIDSSSAIDVVPQVLVQEVAGGRREMAVVSLARRTAATHALSGTVHLSGGQVHITLEFLDVRARVPKRLHTLEVASGPADSLDAIIEDAARRAAGAAVLLFRGIALPIPAERIPTDASVVSQLERASELGCDLRFSEAITTLRGALAQDPGYVPVIATLEYLLVASGEWAAADSFAARLDALEDRMLPSERTWWEYRRAINAGDWASATAAAERGFRAHPSQWGHGAGFVALSTRRLSDAIERLDVAQPASTCLLPQASLFQLRTHAYHLAGRFDRELAEASRFLEAYPGSPLGWEARAAALAAMGNLKSVDSILEVIAVLPPQAGLSPELAAVTVALELRAHGQEAPARAILDRTWAAVSARDTSTRILSQVAFYAGRWAAADSLFDRLGSRDADSASVLRYRAVALTHLGRSGEAQALADRIGRMSSRTHGQVDYYLAVIAAAAGDAAEASRRLDRAFRSGYGFDARYHRDPWWDPVRGDSAFAALIRAR